MEDNELAKTLKARFQSQGAVCEKVLSLFSLLSNKIRFRLLCTLAKGDFCVNSLIDIIDCGNQSNVSQQLKQLTLAELVKKRREGRNTVYYLADDKARSLILFLENTYLVEEAA